jgi:membrane protein implicated in regulation of membrane protease activity
MLRTTVLVIGGIVAAIGAALILTGVTLPGIQALVMGALVVAGILFERRYRHNNQQPDSRWQATGERFVDPTSGKDVEVYYDPSSGERRYVER